MQRVLIDANAVIHGDWMLTGAAWQVLAYRSRHHKCSLIVPEVVLREIVAHYRRTLASALDKAASNAANLQRLGVSVTPTATDLDDATTEYDQHLRRQIVAAHGSIPEPPEVDVLALADRAISRRRPFDEKGSGFRDALIWEHVLNSLDRPYTRVTLITADSAAFYEHGKEASLGEALKSEVADRGFESDAVKVARSIGDYLRSTGTSDAKIEANVAKTLDAQHDYLVDVIREIVLDQPTEPVNPFVEVNVDYMHDPHHLVLAGTYLDPDGNDDLVFVDLDVESDIDVTVSLWDEKRIFSKSTTLDFTVSATFDPANQRFDDISTSGFSVDPERLLDD